MSVNVRAVLNAPVPARHPGSWLLIGVLATVLALPAQAEPGDPLIKVNRKTFAFNDALDRWVLRPTARGYQRFVPNPVRLGVRNFFTNLGTPAVAANQFLQGKPEEGFSDLGRFVLNTTVGLGGLFDVATPTGLPAHQEDFGQTFRTWGAGSGPFLMLPFLGPANTTHAVGMVFDAFTNPVMLVTPLEDRALLVGTNVVDGRAALLSSEQFISGDRYLFIRDAYQQRREHQVHDGEIGDDPFMDDFDDDFDD